MKAVFLSAFSLCLLLLPSFASAQSSWETLIQEVQTPVHKGESHKNTAPATGNTAAGRIEPLRKPTGQSARPTDKNDAPSVKRVMNYRCHNPDIPQCLWDMRYEDYAFNDLENCRDVTAAYLDLVNSYQRCVARVAEKHTDHIIEVFNCVADGRENCPMFHSFD